MNLGILAFTIEGIFMKQNLLQVDFNLWHYFCNMSCYYCVKHIPYYRSGDMIYIIKNGEYKLLCTVSSMMDRAISCLVKLFEKYSVGIISFSGAETFLFPEITDVIAFASKDVYRVQLITNGIKLSPVLISKLEKLSNNIHISLSLDGNTLTSNYARTYNNEVALNLSLRALELLLDSSLSFDIMTVLSKFNIAYSSSFLEYLAMQKKRICVQMWPVFGVSDVRLQKDDAAHIMGIIQNYDNLNLILQPRAYFEAMYDYVRAGVRTIPCFLVNHCVYLNDLGDVKICPCNGLVKFGNVFDVDTPIPMRHPLCGEPTLKVMPCIQCFINWDIINLYLAGKIDLSEITRMSLFSDKDLTKLLTSIKAQTKTE